MNIEKKKILLKFSYVIPNIAQNGFDMHISHNDIKCLSLYILSYQSQNNGS